MNLAEIRAIAEKATPGPWEHILNDEHGRSIFHRFEICKIIKVSSTFSEDDAAFIAGSRQWVPALCDRVEEQDKQLADKDAEIATLRRALEVVHARWINFAGDFSTAECSECGEVYEVSPDEKPREDYFNAFRQCYKFCPTCGARMDGRDQNQMSKESTYYPFCGDCANGSTPETAEPCRACVMTPGRPAFKSKQK